MTLGVILAGGSSRRMGADKALVPVRGRPMAAWVAEALESAATRLLVVGREGTLAGVPCVPDDPGLGRGPLAGLATALGRHRGDPILLVGVDQPFLRSATLIRLVAEADPERVVIPLDRGVPQVTCAVYPGSWREEAEAEARRGGSLRSLVERMPRRGIQPDRWRAWGEDGRSWFSVDDPDRLAEGERRFG